MSEEDRLKLENELLLTKSKAQMINLYLDLQQKVEQLENIRKEAIKKCKDKQYETNDGWLKKFAKEIQNNLESKGE